MKKLLILLISICCAGTLTACSSNDEARTFGDVDVVEKDNEDVDYSDTEKTIEGEPPIVSFNPTKSYYVETSNSIIQTNFDIIVEEAKKCQSDISFSSPMDLADAKKLMNIIFFDTPELFHIGNTYTLKLNDSDLATGVNIPYAMTKEKYEKHKSTIQERIDSLVSSCRELNEYETVQKLGDSLISKKITLEYNAPSIETSVLADYKGNYLSSVFGHVVGNGVSSVGQAKFANYVYREVGLNSVVVLGQTLKNYSAYGYANTSIMGNDDNAVAYENADKSIKATYDFDKVLAWNMVRIKNKWYHSDYALGSLFYNQKIAVIDNSFKLMNDYQTSISKTFYKNEQLLGITPVCNDTEFLYNNVNGTMFPKTKESQMSDSLKSTIEKIYKEENNMYITQFEDESNYYYFVNNFKTFIENFNKENAYVFSTYEIQTYDDSLIFRVKDIRFKD